MLAGGSIRKVAREGTLRLPGSSLPCLRRSFAQPLHQAIELVDPSGVDIFSMSRLSSIASIRIDGV